MSDARIALFYLVSGSGLLMIGGSLLLVWKEKIFIDQESKQPVAIELPLGLRFKSNAPALALFVLGAFLLIYPVMQLKDLNRYIEVDTVPVKGLVHGDVYPVLVYAVRRGDMLNKNGEFKLPVSFLGRHDLDDYRILLVANGRVINEARAERKEWGKEIEVSFTPIVFEPANYQGNVATVPDAYK